MKMNTQRKSVYSITIRRCRRKNNRQNRNIIFKNICFVSDRAMVGLVFQRKWFILFTSFILTTFLLLLIQNPNRDLNNTIEGFSKIYDYKVPLNQWRGLTDSEVCTGFLETKKILSKGKYEFLSCYVNIIPVFFLKKMELSVSNNDLQIFEFFCYS